MIKHQRSGSELYHNFNVDHVQHVRYGEDGEIVGIDDYKCDQVTLAEEGIEGTLTLENGEHIKGHIVFVIIEAVKPSSSHDFSRPPAEAPAIDFSLLNRHLPEDRCHRVGSNPPVIVYLDEHTEMGSDEWKRIMERLTAKRHASLLNPHGCDFSLGPVVQNDDELFLRTVAEHLHPRINETFRTSRDPKTAAALGQPDPDHEPYADPRIRETTFDAEGYVYLPDHVLEELEAAGDAGLRDDHHSEHSVPQGFASQVLNTVRNRGGDYGTPSENHQLTADLLSAHFSRKWRTPIVFTAEDVCLFNIYQKMSRLAYTSKDDSYLDIAGYSENVAMLTPEQRRR